MATTDELLNKITMSVVEAGQVLGISRNAAYDAVKRGEIETIRIGGRIIVPVLPLRKKLGMDT